MAIIVPLSESGDDFPVARHEMPTSFDEKVLNLTVNGDGHRAVES